MRAATVPPPVRTAEDVVAGLRAFADLMEAGAFPGISGPLRADLHVSERADVDAAAAVIDTDPVEEGSLVKDGSLVKATASIAGVELTVYTVDRTRFVRRNPAATAALAERDA